MVSETATTDFLGQRGEAMRSTAEEPGKGPKGRQITGIGAAGFSITSQLPPAQPLEWRQLGEQLVQLLDEKRTGLVIALDEIHGDNRDELARLAAFRIVLAVASPKDIDFLQAMSEDDGPSSTAELGMRLGNAKKPSATTALGSSSLGLSSPRVDD